MWREKGDGQGIEAPLFSPRSVNVYSLIPFLLIISRHGVEPSRMHLASKAAASPVRWSSHVVVIVVHVAHICISICAGIRCGVIRSVAAGDRTLTQSSSAQVKSTPILEASGNL